MRDLDDLIEHADMERKRKREEGVTMATTDPVMHALVDLVEQLFNVGMEGKLAQAHHNAMQVIRERTGLSAVPEGMATRDAIIEECAQAIYKRNEQLCSDPEVCYTEPDTGATVINSRFSDHVEALDEAEAIVRALKQQLPQD